MKKAINIISFCGTLLRTVAEAFKAIIPDYEAMKQANDKDQLADVKKGGNSEV